MFIANRLYNNKLDNWDDIPIIKNLHVHSNVCMYNKENKMVYVTPQEAEQIKAGKMEAPSETTQR